MLALEIALCSRTVCWVSWVPSFLLQASESTLLVAASCPQVRSWVVAIEASGQS